MSAACNPKCLKMIVQSCASKMRLVLKLEFNKALVVYVKDKFGYTYKQGITTDAEGSVFIDMANFPEGFLSPGSGTFQISFKLKDDNCDFYEFADPCDSEQMYKCIVVNAEEIINTNTGGFLQVENATPGGGYLEQENGGRFII